MNSTNDESVLDIVHELENIMDQLSTKHGISIQQTTKTLETPETPETPETTKSQKINDITVGPGEIVIQTIDILHKSNGRIVQEEPTITKIQLSE